MNRIERYVELVGDVNDALRAEHKLRREIRLTTGKTPEMLRQYAKYVQLKDQEQLLLEAWQDAAEYVGIAKDRLEEFQCSTWNTKGGENNEQEPEQQAPEPQEQAQEQL